MNIQSLKNCKNLWWTASKIREKIGDYRSNFFLGMVSGVIHVGANIGQERDLYARHHIDVLWIEPIHDIFLELQENLRPYPRQHAYEYLVTDKDGEYCRFNISNNHGESSSILELHQHKDIWPEVYYTAQITIRSITLASLIAKEGIDIRKYDALVMDTQGSELLVLKGAEDLLKEIRFVKTEVADFESYQGCAQINDMDNFLRFHGFREHYRNKWAAREQGRNYYDIVYRRTGDRSRGTGSC
jgi:FkbM family methyltransferase